MKKDRSFGSFGLGNMPTRSFGSTSSSDEGRRSNFDDEQVEVIGGAPNFRHNEYNDDDKGCCRVLCINCTPLRLRVNIVGLLLITVFCLGLALGISTSPVMAEDYNPKDNIFGKTDSKYLVGVYYYPWHGDDFHNGEGYIRKFLDPPQYPVLGEYDDSKPKVVAQHLKWSRQANIGLWVATWWGPDKLQDTTIRNVILPHEEIGDIKVAVHYESQGRIKDDDTSNVASDITHLCEHMFDHPNYYRIDGRPVIVVYLTRSLQRQGLLEEVVSLMRNAANKCGHDIYIIGDHVFGDAPDLTKPDNRFLLLDAVTNFDVYGSAGKPLKYAGTGPVDDYYMEQAEWRELAHMNDCRFIPAVSPGYNDRGVRLEADHPPLSRKLTSTSEEGSLFRYKLQKALPLVDPVVDNLILVNSFNEWHEDTQIEPCGPLHSTSAIPVTLTGGLQYEGYGELYLDILRDSTVLNSDEL